MEARSGGVGEVVCRPVIFEGTYISTTKWMASELQEEVRNISEENDPTCDLCRAPPRSY